MIALAYLQKNEWSKGNGQCPECSGVPASWHGHPLHKTSETIGHESECPLASAIKELGGAPLMMGEYKSDKKYESYVTNGGFLSTRLQVTES